MLWLAGLMGLMAVGAVSFVEPVAEEDGDEFVDPTSSNPSNGTNIVIPEDNFEPDYDPRGGDDAASLGLAQFTQVELLSGSASDDELSGTVGNDEIRGFDGEDIISGGTGDDALLGDDGSDTLNGDAGNDTLHGQDGADLMSGGQADDELFGHNANDMLFGNAGNDALQGSAGNDQIDGGTGDDTLQGGLDDDTLTGGAGADILLGGWGNDVLSGVERSEAGQDTDDADFLNGGGGDDSILAGGGDIVTSGEGADQIVLGDWITAGNAAQILDYAATDDNIVLIWDDSISDSAEPQVTLEVDSEGVDQTLVLMDGEVVAMVNGTDLIPADIALIPLSTATSVGLATS